MKEIKHHYVQIDKDGTVECCKCGLRNSNPTIWQHYCYTKCLNCHDMELYPDEKCPDCGREA